MRLILLALLLALSPGLACAKTRHAPEPEMLIPPIPPVVVTYNVYVGGINLMSADIAFVEQASRYRARVLGHTAGIWYKFFPWNTELKVEGKIREDQFVPTEFFTRDVWNEKPKSTWLHFQKNGDVKPAFDPPNDDKNRELITLEQRRGSLDPVTGLLQLLAHVAVYNSCATTVPIFEGKRRFDITGVDVGHEEIDEEGYSAFNGTARTCDADFTMVAGEWKDRAPDRFWKRDKDEDGREPFHIWLGTLAPDLPEMAVRLESGSVWGLIVMHLSAWHYATPEEVNF
jgi:hypothetical protein